MSWRLWTFPFFKKCLYSIHIFHQRSIFFSYVYRSRQNSKTCMFSTETNFIFHGEKHPSRVFRWPNLHDMACDNSTAGLVTVDSQFTSGHIDRPAPCAAAIRLHAVPCRGWRRAWRKSLRFRPRGRVSVRGRLAVDRPALCSLQARVCVWNDRCDTLCSCPALLLFQRLAGDPPSDVLAAARWVTARDIVIVCSGSQGPRGVRRLRFLLLGN